MDVGQHRPRHRIAPIDEGHIPTAKPAGEHAGEIGHRHHRLAERDHTSHPESRLLQPIGPHDRECPPEAVPRQPDALRGKATETADDVTMDVRIAVGKARVEVALGSAAPDDFEILEDRAAALRSPEGEDRIAPAADRVDRHREGVDTPPHEEMPGEAAGAELLEPDRLRVVGNRRAIHHQPGEWPSRVVGARPDRRKKCFGVSSHESLRGIDRA